MCDSLQIGGFLRQQQMIEEEHSDEWDFKDDSNLYIDNLMDARQQTKTIVQCGNSNVLLSNSSHLNSNSTAVKRPQVERLSNGKQEETLLNLTRKGKSNCCQGERKRNSYSGDHSVTLMDHEIEQDLYCGEYQRKSMSRLQGIEERESFLDDTQVKNKVTSEAPANSRSEFFSSMDDGKFDKRKTLAVLLGKRSTASENVEVFRVSYI